MTDNEDANSAKRVDGRPAQKEILRSIRSAIAHALLCEYATRHGTLIKELQNEFHWSLPVPLVQLDSGGRMKRG